MIRICVVAALALAVGFTPARAQAPAEASRHVTLTAGAGIISWAPWDADLSVGLEARLDRWVRPRLGLAAEAGFVSTMPGGNCDAACYGPTRAVGVAGHGMIGLGPRDRPDLLSASLGAGVYGVRYVLPARSPDAESRVAPGISGALHLELGSSRQVTPVLTARGLLLPDHAGARARVVSVGFGARW